MTYALNGITALDRTGVAASTTGDGGSSSKDWESEKKDGGGTHVMRKQICGTLVCSTGAHPILAHRLIDFGPLLGLIS